MSENPYTNLDRTSKPSTSFSQTLRKRWLEWLIALGIIVVIAAMVVPNQVSVCYPARPCKNNLKQIGLALHNYHDVWDSFPPAYTVDDHGRRLHSWRVLVLPFIEGQEELFAKIDFTKPWIHPDNAEARAMCPAAFRCEDEDAKLPEGFTSYKAIVGKDGVFCSGDDVPRSIDDVLDGTSQTLAVIETTREHSVHWMNPDDDGAMEFLQLLKSHPPTAHAHAVRALFVDGSVHSLGFDTPDETLRALATYAGGEAIDNEDF